MKYTIVTLAFAAIVSAQSLSDIPQCALPCIDSARTSSTSCSASDYACICKNKDAITAAATSCVLQACGADVATSQVLPAVNTFCNAVESGSGGSSSASASAPASSSSSSAIASTTSTDVTSTSAGATETSTESATSSSETSTSSSTTPMASTTVSGSNSTTSSATSQPTTVPTAGASSVASSLAMLVLGFVVTI